MSPACVISPADKAQNPTSAQDEFAVGDMAMVETEDNYGPDRRGHKPRERKCIIRQSVRERRDMIRFVLSPDNVVTPDVTEKLPGRGVWVSANCADLDKADRKAFTRAFKRKCIRPDDLTTLTETILKRRLLGTLSMAHKAGHLALGYDQVKSMATGTPLAFRIEARDGSDDGRGKIRTLSKAIAHELNAPLPPVIGCFTAQDLGKALQRDHVVHIGVCPGGFARSLKTHVHRLSGFVDMIPAEWPDKLYEPRIKNAAKTLSEKSGTAP